MRRGTADADIPHNQEVLDTGLAQWTIPCILITIAPTGAAAFLFALMISGNSTGFVG